MRDMVGRAALANRLVLFMCVAMPETLPPHRRRHRDACDGANPRRIFRLLGRVPVRLILDQTFARARIACAHTGARIITPTCTTDIYAQNECAHVRLSVCTRTRTYLILSYIRGSSPPCQSSLQALGPLVGVTALTVVGLSSLSVLQAFLVAEFNWPQEVANYVLLGIHLANPYRQTDILVHT